MSREVLNIMTSYTQTIFTDKQGKQDEIEANQQEHKERNIETEAYKCG